MSVLFALLLAVLGIAVLFVVPWIGAAVLAAAVVTALIGILWTGANADELAHHDDPERPHMRGPSS
jgi:hypothetical protein